MTSLQPAADAAPADWLLAGRDAWQDLVRFGPSGFQAYLRVPVEDSQRNPFATVLAILISATVDPDHCDAAIWEGWTSEGVMPTAPHVDIPNRRMLLFRGPAATLLDAPRQAWSAESEGWVAPHLMWPSDRSWCLACDVDEELEFTLGCSTETAGRLRGGLANGTRQVAYGSDLGLP